MFKAQLKITGTRPNIERICENFLLHNFLIKNKKDSVLLTVSVPTMKGFQELVRRLKSKKDRKSKVHVLELIKDG